ncbi:MAG: hypothetical protein HYU84_03035 [Chloroflexi bacterium]|nr:hypothetical protein [Chloroflexota bacterium]MBI3167865.1 hypothetical protein [Chloroflexota bacterium]
MNLHRLNANERETSSMLAQFSDSPKKVTFNPEGNESADACIPNISPAERQKRMRFGIIQLAITFIILAVLLLLGADKLWRLPLFALFSAGTVSIFQAFDKT